MAGEDVPISLAELFDRPAWMADALCREYPDVSFFPTRGQPTSPAKNVCAHCMVRQECLDYISSFGYDENRHGVWGGTSPRERQHQPLAA
jgi:WhiB family redox-sensing transcriptional regulator